MPNFLKRLFFELNPYYRFIGIDYTVGATSVWYQHTGTLKFEQVVYAY